MYVVIFEYNRDENNVWVPDNVAGPITIHGPFNTEEAAIEWMNNQPDDTDVREAHVAPLNDPKDRE